MPEQALTLDAVHFICRDIGAMERFYKDVVGLEQRRPLVPFPDGPQDPWVEFRTGSASLVLKPHGQYDGDPRPAEMASIHIGLRAPTVEALERRYERLRDRGATFETPPIDWPWNERAFFLRDPEGNLVEIYHGDTPAPVAQNPDQTIGIELVLDAVHITCNDLAATARFYREQFGLAQRRTMVPFPDGPQDPWPELETGGTSLVLKPIGPYDGEARPATMAGTHLGFRVSTPEEVDAHHARIAANGVTFDSPPVLWIWNERACFTHDPEGNVVEIYHGAANPYELDRAA